MPRPETEVMTGWAIEQLRPMVYAVARGESRHLPVVVELGTGSGAVAKSIATELTATLLLAPIGTRTLATQFWSESGSLAYGAAAPYALLLVLLSVPATIMLGRMASTINATPARKERP